MIHCLISNIITNSSSIIKEAISFKFDIEILVDQNILEPIISIRTILPVGVYDCLSHWSYFYFWEV